jgi:hypothetical protein
MCLIHSMITGVNSGITTAGTRRSSRLITAAQYGLLLKNRVRDASAVIPLQQWPDCPAAKCPSLPSGFKWNAPYRRSAATLSRFHHRELDASQNGLYLSNRFA